MPAGESIGEAYVTIRPDTSKFQEEANSKLGPALKGVGDQAAGAGSKIGGIGEEADKASGKVGGISSTVKVLAGAAVGFGAISMFKGMIAEGTEAQKIGAQTEAAIKSTGGAAQISAKQIGDLTGSLSKKVGIDDEEIQRGANMLLTFTNVKNMTAEQTKEIDKNRQAMAGSVAGGKELADAHKNLEQAVAAQNKAQIALDDLETIQAGKKKLTIADEIAHRNAVLALNATLPHLTEANVQLTKAQENANVATKTLLAGVAGGNDIFTQATKLLPDMSKALGQDMAASAMQLGKALNDPIAGVTALQRVGVKLTEQQKDQVAAFVKAGDTASAQKIILKELTTEFGGSAAAQATAGEKMKVAWSNLEEKLGTAVLPTMNKVVGVATSLIEKFTNLPGPIQAAVIALGGLAVAVGLVSSVMENVLIKALVSAGVSALTMAGEVVGAMVLMVVGAGASATAIAIATGGITLAIGAIVLGIYELVTHWSEVWGFVKDVVAGAADWIKSHIEIILAVVALPIFAIYELWKHWGDVWGWIRDAVPNAIGAILGWLADLPAKLAFLAGWAVGEYIRFWLELPGRIWGVLMDVWHFLEDFVPKAIEWTYHAARDVVEAYVGFWLSLPGRIWDLLVGGAGVAGKIIGAIPHLVGAAKEATGQFVTGFLVDLYLLPGRLGETINNMINGIGAFFERLYNAAKSLAGKFVSGFLKGLIPGSPYLPERVITGIAEHVSNTVDAIGADFGRLGSMVGFPGGSSLVGAFGGGAGPTFAPGAVVLDLRGATVSPETLPALQATVSTGLGQLADALRARGA